MGRKEGMQLCLFPHGMRWSIQPTGLNGVVEARGYFCVSLSGNQPMPLQQRVVSTINPQSARHCNRKPAPITEMSLKKSVFSVTWYFWKILPWNSLVQKRKNIAFIIGSELQAFKNININISTSAQDMKK